MTWKSKNLLGMRFGKLIVVECLGLRVGGNHWRCQCECGEIRVNKVSNLTSGRVQSCGCARAEKMRIRRTTHGMYKTATYASWIGMKGRCTNPKNHKFWDYGGRGISVCERWAISFESFLADMGEKPKKKTLDRINNNGNYEPGNCRWATPHQQSINRRPKKTFRRFNVLGFFGTIPEIGKYFKIHVNTLNYRIFQRGMPIESAVTFSRWKRVK